MYYLSFCVYVVSLKFLFYFFIYFVCINIFPVHVSVYHLCARCLWRPNEGTGLPGVTDGYKPPPCGCREQNLSPLEEWPVFLTTEPSLQPLINDSV